MNIEYLRKLGFSEGEVKVYKAVLEIGASTLGSIQEKVSIDRRNIYDILNKLIEKGLVSYTIEKGKKTFQPTNPSKILELIENKKKEIDFVEKETSVQLPDLLNRFNEKKQQINAEIFRGTDSMKALLEESLNYKEIYFMGGNSVIEDTSASIWFDHWMKRRAEKKVWMYDLVDYGTELHIVSAEDEKKHKKMYYKYCQLPKNLSSPLIIFVFGNKVAQILWEDKQFFAFVLESEEIRDSFM